MQKSEKFFKSKFYSIAFISVLISKQLLLQSDVVGQCLCDNKCTIFSKFILESPPEDMINAKISVTFCRAEWFRSFVIKTLAILWLLNCSNPDDLYYVTYSWKALFKRNIFLIKGIPILKLKLAEAAVQRCS